MNYQSFSVLFGSSVWAIATLVFRIMWPFLIAETIGRCKMKVLKHSVFTIFKKIKIFESHFEPHKMTLQQYLEKCSERYKNTPDTPLAKGQSTFT